MPVLPEAYLFSLDGMFGCRAFIQGIVKQKKAEWSCGSSEPSSDLLCPPSGCSWKSGAAEDCLGSPLGHLQSPRSLKRGNTGTSIPVAHAHWSAHRLPEAGVSGGGEGTRAANLTRPRSLSRGGLTPSSASP